MESCGLQRKKQPAIGNAYPDRGRPVVSERGLSGVGVDALTDAAGLTHGSLYSQFGSKERLAAEALSHALNTNSVRMSDVATLDDYVTRYLSADHRERRGDGCVMAALAVKSRARAPRSSATSRMPYERSRNRSP